MTFSSLGVVMSFVLCLAGPVALEAAETAPAPMSSTKERGVVSIVPEPALSQGRLVLKVVAFNRTRTPAALGISDDRCRSACTY